MREGRRVRVRGRLLAPGLVLLLHVVSVVPVVGQTSPDTGPALERVDSLARAGSMEGARQELLHWYDVRSEAAGREDLQRALWFRAVLTVDPSQAALDLRRLAVEYPGGPWTPGARLRLGLLAEAGDRPGEAAEHYRVLVRDHPGSGMAAAATARLERVAAVPARAAPSAGQRASGEPSASAGPAPDFTVQLGAFSSLDRALKLVARAREAGLEVRLVTVPGSDLVRVRSGRFADRESAGSLYDRVVAGGFEAVVVAGASGEVPAG